MFKHYLAAFAHRPGVFKAREPQPEQDAIITFEGERKLVARSAPFGPNYFFSNILMMADAPRYNGQILRAPTPAESIIVLDHDFPSRARRKILDVTECQVGLACMGWDGVFVNPPRDNNGKYIADEERLRALLGHPEVTEVDGALLFPNNSVLGVHDFGFVKYSAFIQGKEQTSSQFSRSSLARLLEHTTNQQAKHLASISRTDYYPNGVYIHGFRSYNFSPGQIPLCVITLFSGDDAKDTLELVATPWFDSPDGYMYGVYDSPTIIP